MTDQRPIDMRALGFHRHGDWNDVLRLETMAIPRPGAGEVRVKVTACGLNPMDAALCQGIMPGSLPGGIGLDLSGIVDAVGPDVSGVEVGDRVFGAADYQHYPSAGAADYAVLSVWEPVPEGLGMIEAAVLPMAVKTAVRSLDLLGVGAGQTLLINGGGTMVGFAAVQVALMRGARVIATADDTFADQLRAFGAWVTPYGDGMGDRVREIAGGAPDWVLHTALVPGVLPDLIEVVDGDPKRVMSITDFDEGGLGVRTTGREVGLVPRYDALAPHAKLAAEGRFTIPIAQTFGMDEWNEAMTRSQSGHARGKVLILPASSTTSA